MAEEKVTIHGENFGFTSPTVKISSVSSEGLEDVSILSYSHDLITIKMPPGYGTAKVSVIAGPSSERLVVPAGSNLTYQYAPPELSSSTWGSDIPSAVISGYFNDATRQVRSCWRQTV